MPPAGHLRGTAEYVAPEVLAGARPSSASDIWALGCLVFYLFAGRPPFVGDSNDALFAKISAFGGVPHDAAATAATPTTASGAGASGSTSASVVAPATASAASAAPPAPNSTSLGLASPSAVATLAFPRDFPPTALSLVAALLEPSPTRRLVAAAALRQHPFFAGLDWAALRDGAPPPLVAAAPSGSASAHAAPPAFAQRRFSMMLSPMPARYRHSDDGGLPPIEELDEDAATPPRG